MKGNAMNMDANEPARLRAVAEAATPGTWIVGLLGTQNYVRRRQDHAPVVAARELGDDSGNADMVHIATFDPPTVLALLDELAALRAEVERLTAQKLGIGELASRYAIEASAARADSARVVAAVEAVCAEVEADDRAHLNDVGQHLSGSVVVVAEMVRAAIAATVPTEADKPGPDPDGGIDLTDEEFAAFLKAARG